MVKDLIALGMIEDAEKKRLVIQKQANFFSLRLKVPVENIRNEQLVKVAEVARCYGKG